MSVSALLLRDFKCFKEIELPCAQLTVLTGYNAAGKSTALHALLLMAQALRSNPISNRLALNGDLVSLGSAGDVIRNGAESQGICLGAKGADEQIRWTFEYDRRLSARGVMALKSAEYDSPLRPETSGSQMVPGPHAADSDLLRVLQETVFVGPGRMTQLSTYPVPRTSWQARGNVGMSGEYAAYWYLECADEEVDLGRRHQRERDARTVRSQIEAWLDEFFPGARVGAQSLVSRITCPSGVSAYREQAVGCRRPTWAMAWATRFPCLSPCLPQNLAPLSSSTAPRHTCIHGHSPPWPLSRSDGRRRTSDSGRNPQRSLAERNSTRRSRQSCQTP